MSKFRFLHAADIHLDSQLKGLEAYEGAPVERIRTATRTAFENLIQLALNEQVDFVVIAGDLFDGRWTDLQTGLWCANQFRQLEKASIPVYLLRGNHDAEAEVPQRLSWPANVHEFSTSQPSTFKLDEIKVALHGQGFATRSVDEDLSLRYPEPTADCFNIGVLHTSLAGDPQHDTYAPTSVENLTLKGYDYWALGHIHQQCIHRESPYVVYSGCLQGRHIQEPGAKGCYLIEVDRDHVAAHFRELDTLRWESISIEVQPDWSDIIDLYDAVRIALHGAVESHDHRFLATRITISGTTSLHAKVADPIEREQVINEIRNIGNAMENIWVEKVVIKTTPEIDLAQLKGGQDLVGEILREFDRWQDATDEELLQLAAELDPIGRKAATELKEIDLNLKDPAQIRAWLTDAEAMVVSMLASENRDL